MIGIVRSTIRKILARRIYSTRGLYSVVGILTIMLFSFLVTTFNNKAYAACPPAPYSCANLASSVPASYFSPYSSAADYCNHQTGAIGFAYFSPYNVTISPNGTATVQLMTFVCNGSNATIGGIQDYYGPSYVSGVGGSSGAISYDKPGTIFSIYGYAQVPFGQLTSKQYWARSLDVTVNGSKFGGGDGSYSVQIKGFGVVDGGQTDVVETPFSIYIRQTVFGGLTGSVAPPPCYTGTIIGWATDNNSYATKLKILVAPENPLGEPNSDWTPWKIINADQDVPGHPGHGFLLDASTLGVDMNQVTKVHFYALGVDTSGVQNGNNPEIATVNVNPCPKTNNPYLRASTNDVFSGALFEATPGDQCLAYNPFLRSSIGQAKIQTNTLNSLDLETKYQLTLRAVYHTMLGRGLNPSDPAIAAWRANPSLPWDTNFSAATSALISAISGSAEYKTTGLGKWQYATPSPNWNNFVTDLYTNSFGREADSGGLAAWTAGLSAGTQQPNSLIQRFVETEDVGAFGLGTNSYNGGIANYGGSGAEYAAFSTGSIPFSTNQGFVGYNGRVAQRAGNGAGDWRYDLLFSNDTASPYGSYTAIPLCLPDLYDTYNDASKYTPMLVTSMADLSSKIASISTADPTVLKMSSSFNLSGLTIPASKHIILLGPDANDVTVTGNIIYAPYVLNATTNTVPSFQLITKGRNIMVNGTVSRLDGMYVAQPGVTGVAPSKTIDSNGVIQTCENYTGLCATTQLVVNGSLVAQHLKLNRTYGSVGYSWNNQTTQYNKACLPLTGYDYNSALGYNYLYRSGTPPASDVSGASPTATGGQGTVNACAAEWVNFSPEAYLSAAAATGSTNTSAAQSFQELPPIY